MTCISTCKLPASRPVPCTCHASSLGGGQGARVSGGGVKGLGQARRHALPALALLELLLNRSRRYVTVRALAAQVPVFLRGGTRVDAAGRELGCALGLQTVSAVSVAENRQLGAQQTYVLVAGGGDFLQQAEEAVIWVCTQDIVDACGATSRGTHSLATP